eukprot:maker-scaffold1179_size56971-snap-gene-0.15 protein:Tk06630 transcript:maker-scaffold1179_size56971-snap-gene-0.15-mRNA-1 annotation:"calcitonin-like diuretic hormone receptor 2"
MPKFLIRLRPRGRERLIENEDPSEFWRDIYGFLEEEDAFNFSKQHTDVDRESVQNLHDCLARIVQPDGANGTDSFMDESPQAHWWCPMAFDSWTCWNATPPDQEAMASCPQVLGYNAYYHAYRFCETNGTWQSNPDTDTTYTDYSECIDLSEGMFHRGIVIFSILGTVLSLLALIAALATFQFLGSLNCGRIQIHKNLFMALILTNFLWLRWYLEVLLEPTIGEDNPLWCRVLHVVMMYFTVSTYSWVLCEGLYLQLMLTTRGQMNEGKVKLLLFLFGWFSPVFILVPYTLYRQAIPEEDVTCWMEFGSSQWFLSIPVGLILLVNVGILTKVIIVLRNKLKAGGGPRRARANSNPAVTIKSVRAVFMLIPILGLQFLVVPIRPDEESPIVRVYDVISAFLASYQGVIISLIFCFLNGEVSKAIARKWTRFKLGPHSRVITQVENAGLYLKELGFDQKRRRRSDTNLSKLMIQTSAIVSDEHCECHKTGGSEQKYIIFPTAKQCPVHRNEGEKRRHSCEMIPLTGMSAKTSDPHPDFQV